MRYRKDSKLFTKIVSTFFIFLFVYTAIAKLQQPEAFLTTLSQMLGLTFFANVLTYVIPITELMIAALLLFPSRQSDGLLLTSILMLLFFAFIGLLLLNQSKLPCSCGGILEAISWKGHLLFNALCTGLAFTAWRIETKTKKLSIHQLFYSNKTGEAENLQQSRHNS